MPRQALVTGCGIISSIGINFRENLESLLKGRSGIGEIRLLDTRYRGILPAGEIGYTNDELTKMMNLGWEKGRTRTALLGIIAAMEAARNAGIDLDDGLRTGLISGTTVGGMVASELYYLDFLNNDSRNEWIDSHDCADATERIARLLGIRDYISTINTACSSSANAIMLGVRLIRAGIIDRAIAGGTDALSKFTLNGFNTLMIHDQQHCKPFDEQRNGLNLGEGAAFLVIEREDLIRDRKPLCMISGYGNATDAFHQTALSPEGEGAYLSMKDALERSGLTTSDIGYINAHGTGTVNNDLSEGKAIERLFSSGIPHMSSTKSFTGHLLGASGAVEAVFSIISLLHDVAFPNLNFRNPMKELAFKPVEKAVYGSGIKHVLSNSFGFGGNNTSLIFSKC